MKRVNESQGQPSKAMHFENSLPIIGQKLCCYLAIDFDLPPTILNSVYFCFPLHSLYYPDQEPLVPVYYQIHVWIAELGFEQTMFASNSPEYG